MNMPGFTAEASLPKPSEAYRVVRRLSGRDGHASVVPARMPWYFCSNIAVACNKGNKYACVIGEQLCLPD